MVSFVKKQILKYILFHHWMQKKDASMPKNGGRLKGEENESWLDTYIFVFFRSFTFLNEVVEFETNIVFLWSLACTILKVQQ